VISNKEYPNIFGSFSPKGAYYVSPRHCLGLAYNHISQDSKAVNNALRHLIALVGEIFFREEKANL